MEKINFSNLPSTTTPINASNLNTMQDNIEAGMNDLPIAIYRSSGTAFDDPDTTNYGLILTSLNTPESGVYYYIKTFFFQKRNEPSAKSQIAIGYNSNKVWQRYYYNGAWSNWLLISHPNITTGTEFKTGRIIDGKEEYGKRISIGALPNATSQDYPHGLSNVTFTRPLEGFCTSGGGTTFNMPNTYPDSSNMAQYSIGAWTVEGNIRITTLIDRSGYRGYVTLYYTKNS